MEIQRNQRARVRKHSFHQYLGLSLIKKEAAVGAKNFQTREQLREAAGKFTHTERKRKAKKSLYDYFQPWSMPTGKQLVNRIIDFMSMINNKLEWCQGKVTKCIRDDPPLVILEWDTMPKQVSN